METTLEHSAAPEQMKARAELIDLFRKCPMPAEDALFNLFMYARSGLLVKALVMDDLYKRFMPVPGIMCEFGVWYGQNAILLENLRAIHEPFNKTRRYIGFDSWGGYPDKPDWYNAGEDGYGHLQKLLDCHARMNVYGHLPHGHELVQGDVCETVPRWFRENEDALVAFAYVDMGPYKPTLAVLEAIQPRLVPGSIVLLDELTLPTGKGEAQAFRHVFGNSGYRIERHPLYASKAVVTIV